MRWKTLTVVTLLVMSRTASAQTYVVQDGDTLSEIAQAHGIDVSELARANDITDPDTIRPGQVLTLGEAEGRVVERGVLHKVLRGVTLRRIARAYDVPMRRLIKVNRIRNADILRRGREILVPGATKVVPIATRYRPPCLHDPVEIYMVHTGESLEVVLTKCDGSLWEEGQAEVSRFLDRTKNHTAPLLNGRLLRMLQKVADHWEGRRVEVVSAYRPPRGERSGSRHHVAKALDFRIAGVPNEQLRDFARTLSRVGVGYYPNSTFVHLDVRERSGFWVDWAGPGEPARYGTLEGGDPGEEAAALRRARVAAARRARAHVTRHRRSRGAVASRRSTAAAP